MQREKQLNLEIMRQQKDQKNHEKYEKKIK